MAKRPIPCMGGRCVVGLDAHATDPVETLSTRLRGQPALALAHQKYVGKFEMKDTRNNRRLQRNAATNSLGLGASFILKAPRQRDGRVNDESHLRPSSRRAFQSRPPRVDPLRISKSSSKAFKAALGSCGAARTIFTTGRPCLVIVMSSPAAARAAGGGDGGGAAAIPKAAMAHLF